MSILLLPMQHQLIPAAKANWEGNAPVRIISGYSNEMTMQLEFLVHPFHPLVDQLVGAQGINFQMIATLTSLFAK